MSTRVIADRFSTKSIIALFCKFPPTTEKGKIFFPEYDLKNVNSYSTFKEICPGYFQLKDKYRESSFVIDTTTNKIYTMSNMIWAHDCQELIDIALECGDIDEDEITIIPEGCTWRVDWINDSSFVKLIYPIKQILRDLLEIANPQTSSSLHLHLLTKKLLDGSLSVDEIKGIQ